MKQVSSFENYLLHLERAARLIDCSTAELASLKKPDQVIEREIVVDGVSHPAWCVLYNNALGPYKGGIRFHPSANLDETMTLAANMPFKTALLGIPFGGAKSAVRINTREFDEREHEEGARGFMRAFSHVFGVNKYIGAPDMYPSSDKCIKERIMAFMLDEYEKIVGHSEPGVVTGKPIVLGGSRGRDSATAQGGVYVLEALRKERHVDEQECVRVAIQGFGEVGYHIARLLHFHKSHRYRIVAVSDTGGAVFSPKGLDPRYLKQVKDAEGTVMAADMAHIDHGGNDELLSYDCDVFVPAAEGGQIREDNADKVRARIILELANVPVTAAADKVLQSKNVTVLPGILANAGGVAVSYFEWVQNRTGVYWSESEVRGKLKPLMEKAYNSVSKMASSHNTTLRDAAFALGVKRIIEAERLRGRYRK